MPALRARPPPLVLMIYAANGGGFGEYLTASGFRVEEVHAGVAGCERAAALQPDLIVLDYGLDGETVAGLKHEPATSAIPIIALTEFDNLRARRNTVVPAPGPES